MVITEDLVYFLKNGRFENINFGITKKEFVEILGEPEFETPPSNSIISFEYDGCFEFYFLTETWKQIKTQRFCCVVFRPKDESKSSVLQFNSYNWTLEFSLEQGLEFLNDHDIKFDEIPYFEKDYRQFKTEGNVTVGFIDNEESGNFTFYKISREVELSPLKPPTKQVSFEIEEVYYEKLREEAEKTRISIANLCREIIEKHLEDK